MDINTSRLPVLAPGLLPDPAAQQTPPGGLQTRGQKQSGAHPTAVAEVDRLAAARRFEQVLERSTRQREAQLQERQDTRSRNALQAYQATQGAEENDQLSQLLGIDVFA